jgi:hypothetical protein
MQRHVVSLKQTDVSEVRTVSTITVMMEAVRNSETLVYFNETTQSYIPGGCHLQINNLKCKTKMKVTQQFSAQTSNTKLN